MAQHGIPLIYYSDNGGGEKNRVLDADITGILPRLGVEHHTGIPGNPQGRGVIERANKGIPKDVALSFQTYCAKDADKEATVEVDRNDIEDDQIMGYALQARDAGQSAAELPADIVASLINNGFTSPCYDGQMFFDTDHLVAGKSVSNKGTKKLKVGSLAEAKASYGAARTAMRSLKDDEGASLRIRPNLLVVPPALEDDANYLMTAEKFPDGTPNPYRNTAEVLVMPELTSDSAWFLFDTSRSVKPLIFQQRKKPVFVEQTDYNSDNVFMRKKFRFGAEARCNGGYGFWQMAFGSDGTTE
nr:Mu-like prophage major head subunit gpT family protein [Escherichia coli]